MGSKIGSRELALRAQREQEAKQTERKVMPPEPRQLSAIDARPRPRPVAAAGASAEKTVKKLPAVRRARKAVVRPKTRRAGAKKGRGSFDKNLFQKIYMRDYRAAKRLGIPIAKYRAQKAAGKPKK